MTSQFFPFSSSPLARSWLRPCPLRATGHPVCRAPPNRSLCPLILGDTRFIVLLKTVQTFNHKTNGASISQILNKIVRSAAVDGDKKKTSPIVSSLIMISYRPQLNFISLHSKGKNLREAIWVAFGSAIKENVKVIVLLTVKQLN